MTLFLHEIKRSKLSLIIWSAALSAMLLLCIIIYPEMKIAMGELGEIFANMGEFTDAMGMEMMINGDFLSYFALECGEFLGICGAVFAAIAGIGALAKEQRDRTAELLLTQPVTRNYVVTQKLLSALLQIVILNAAVIAVSLIGIFAIGEAPDGAKLALIFLSYFILQIIVALICFGISAFIRRGGFGIAIGLSLAFYFLNIIANLSEEVEFLKYATPFAFTDPNHILEHTAIDWKYMIGGAVLAVGCTVLAYVRYNKKDIL